MPKRLRTSSEPPVKPPSLIRRYKDSDAWLWTEVAAVVIGLAFIVPTGRALWIDLKDRQTQRIALAWETVTRPAPGNSGKGPALEYLNSQGIPLVGIDLSVEANDSPAYLYNANLSGARLMEANLSGARLSSANLSGVALHEANLSGAYLDEADLSDANLVRTNLSGAELRRADLSDAYLHAVDLSNVKLWGADLSGADLQFSHVSQENLDTACGDKETRLPDGLTIKACDVK